MYNVIEMAGNNEIDHRDPIFEEMLNRVDRYRAVKEAVDYTTPKLSALGVNRNEWNKTEKIESQIKEYLGIVDPVISTCLLSI